MASYEGTKAVEQIANSVPTLEGTQNFGKWRQGLRHAADCVDEDLWSIMTGRIRSPISEPRTAPAVEAVRQQLIGQLGREPTDVETQEWVQEHITGPNEQLEWFDARHRLGRHLIYKTINDAARTFMSDGTDSFEAFQCVASVYSRHGHSALTQKWASLNALTYSNDAHAFVASFQLCLEEANAIVADHPLPPE
ncbi:Uncharacterized protein PECH_005846 [Penicillium ucsense]|uniref:Uncharacterized protein n=1 Tax=Penicillium ucsense TaxID=2839758 RepID=A0A8J8WAR6_9EURO|nr:Uncharacterized protein PECM_000739 [Penicillium ucsense]KAF7736038.1 Uncharacterized protein PECH_005846 [Penicillium ucsense]